MSLLLVEINISIFLLAAVIFGAALMGFLFRSRQLRKQKQKVFELEKEMLLNHAEILNLQKQKLALEGQVKKSDIPVIPLTPKDESDKKIADKRTNS